MEESDVIHHLGQLRLVACICIDLSLLGRTSNKGKKQILEYYKNGEDLLNVQQLRLGLMNGFL